MDPEIIRKVFKEHDTNADGYLHENQVKVAMDALHVPCDSQKLQNYMRLTATGKNRQHFTLPQFIAFVGVQHTALRESFEAFDLTGDGKLCERDIMHICRRNNIPLSPSQIHTMIAQLDTDGSGAVEFDEFAAAFFSLADLSARSVFDAWLDHSSLETGGYGGALELAGDHDTPSAVLLMSGAIAGAVSRTLTAPMDRLRTLLQAQVQSPKLSAKYNVPQYVGIWSSLKSIYEQAGWSGFWRGNGANVIKIAPETAIRFWAYEEAKKIICKDLDNVSVSERFMAGALAGSLAQLIIYPLEIAKTRIALSSYSEYAGIMHCLTSCIKREGFLSMYKGLGVSLLGIIPYAGVDLAVFNTLKECYQQKYEGSQPGVGTLLACGALATTCGQLVTYPLQLVRTRLQAQGMKGRQLVLYKGLTDCLLQTVRHEGYRGLYKGLTANFMKTLPAISISYAVYESTKNRLMKEHKYYMYRD